MTMMVETVEITDIVRTTDRAYIVRLKQTGKTVSLSKRFTQFRPGAAVIPAWLAKRISGNHPKLARRLSGGTQTKEDQS